MRKSTLGWIAAIGTLFAPCAPAFTVYGVNPAQALVRFDSATPAAITVIGTVTGLGVGDGVVGMDFRPDGSLYAIARTLGNGGALYRIDTATVAATLVAGLSADPTDATAPCTSLAGPAQFGVDFNPLSDRIRLVGDNGLNLRVNPDNGQVITDVFVSFNAVDPAHVAAVAYTNSYKGATSTTLYGFE